MDENFVERYEDFPITEEMIEQIKINSRHKYRPDEAPIILTQSLAYVQQNPWIQNKTIKDNILFGLPYDPEKYQETIRICELTRDLEILPGGD